MNTTSRHALKKRIIIQNVFFHIYILSQTQYLSILNRTGHASVTLRSPRILNKARHKTSERWVRSILKDSKKKTHPKWMCFLFGDPYGTRTHDTTVKGWCLNRLTNGPLNCRAYSPFYIKTTVSLACLGSGGQIRTNDLPGMNRPL